VWRRSDGRALVASVDVFTPIVDDAATWGRIAAVNAASDVYAMGGTPLFALAIAGWPRDELPLELLAEVLGGGQDAALESGWIVAGGHTIDGPEPLYGQAVIGEVEEDAVLTHAGGRPGDVLVLSKPIGTGLVATAVKRRDPSATGAGGALHDLYAAAVREMGRPNAVAADVARRCGAHAATDVTGFGLLGHLRSLAVASGVGAEVEFAAVPRLPDVEALLVSGDVPGGTRRNLQDVLPHLDLRGEMGDAELLLLADAQTSGGLLLAIPPDRADDAVTELVGSGHGARIVGRLGAAEPGRIVIRA
jgi:selenide, water dikinase